MVEMTVPANVERVVVGELVARAMRTEAVTEAVVMVELGMEGLVRGCSARSSGGGSYDGGGGGSCSSCPLAACRNSNRSASAQEKEKAQAKHRSRLMNGRVGGRARPMTSMAAAQLATSMGAYLAASRGQPDDSQMYSIDDPYQAYGLDCAREDYGLYGQQQGS